MLFRGKSEHKKAPRSNACSFDAGQLLEIEGFIESFINILLHSSNWCIISSITQREVIFLQHLYIDESGSMTSEYTEQWPYFTVAIVVSPNKERAKRVVKRFVSKKMNILKESDTAHKMFLDGNFHELKGSCMRGDTQAEFIDYMCRNDIVKVFLIQVKNENIRYGLYKNTARAFNYILGQALTGFLSADMLPRDEYMLHIDERNQKTGTTHSLEDYLNIQLCIDRDLADSVTVRYYDSAQNSLIQVADVFSNAYYKHCMKNGEAEYVSDMLNQKTADGYFPAVYQFPQKVIKLINCAAIKIRSSR